MVDVLSFVQKLNQVTKAFKQSLKTVTFAHLKKVIKRT